MLLRPLPYPNPGKIVFVAETILNTERSPVSYPNFLDWQHENNVFQNLAAYAQSEVNLKAGENVDHVSCEVVSHSYFDLLGIPALSGRVFRAEGDRAPGRQPFVVLSYGLWRRAFGGDAAVIGRSIQLNENAFTVLGVLPAGFRGFSGQADVWIPIQMRDVLWPESAKFKLLQNRGLHWVSVIGRLKPGVTLAQAQAEMSAIGASLGDEYPETNRSRGVAVAPAKQAVVGGLRAPLLILFCAAGCVLLIACANIANLSLVRAITRRRESAIRLSLGASPARLVRQFLTEGFLLATLGGSLGLLLALWTIKVLAVNLSALSSYAHLRVNAALLVFTAFTTGITALLVGSLPAWSATRLDLSSPLKESAGCSASKRQGRAREALVVLQTATVVLLMIAAGLLLRSFGRMSQIAPGFRPDHLLTLRVHVPNRGYTRSQGVLLSQRLVQKIEFVPGVELAAADTADLFVWDGVSRKYAIEGRPPVPTSEADTVYYHEVSSGFFKTMGIPLEAGRDFRLSDDVHAPRVVIISRSFAQRYWPRQDPVGKRLKFGAFDSSGPWMIVIGVVGDYRYHDYLANPDDTPVFYGALAQNPHVGEFSLLVRTKTDPGAMVDPLRRAIEKLDPTLPVYSVATLEARIAAQSARARGLAELVTLFALLALALAMVGLYGVLSYAVGQRTREIGIRMALGAQSKDVLGMVLIEGLRLALLGISCGYVSALALVRLLRTLLFGVTATDPITFAAVGILLMLVAFFACHIPARRATRIDPMMALKRE